MAKPPPVERFRISCETDVTSLGPVMSALAKVPGLIITGNELIEEVRSFARNQYTGHQIKAEDFLTDWLPDHPEFKAKEAVEHFRANGACYKALRTLSANGALRKLGEGRYSTLAAKRQPKKEKPVAGPKKERHAVNHRDFMLRTASRNHGRFNTNWMKEQFTKDDRIPGNVSPTIAVLMKKRLIKRVGDSEYVLTAKKAAPKKTDKPAMNGKAVEVEVAANG